MKNKNIFGVVSLMLVGLMMIGSVSASLSGTTFFINEDLEKDIQLSLENADYDDWRNSIISSLTEENFEAQVSLHNNMKDFEQIISKLIEAWQNGDEKSVEKLREELTELVGDSGDGQILSVRSGFVEGAELEDFSFDEENGFTNLKDSGEVVVVSSGFIDASQMSEEEVLEMIEDSKNSKKSFWDVFRFW